MLTETIKKEQRCFRCGRVRQITMYPTIVADEAPEIKKTILDEKIFDFTCSSCGFNVDYVYPMLYHDRDKKLMIYLTQNEKTVNESRLPLYLKQVKKRVVPDLKALKEKILIFESGYDDIAIEMVKSAVQNIIMKKYDEGAVKIYFQNGDETCLFFAIYFSQEIHPSYRTANIKLYNQALDILNSSDYKESNNFLKTDRDFVQEIIARSK